MSDDAQALELGHTDESTNSNDTKAITDLDAIVAAWAEFQEGRDREWVQDSMGGMVRNVPRHIWDSEVESSRIITRVRSALVRWTGQGSIYERRLAEILASPDIQSQERVYHAVGVAKALRDDITAHGLGKLNGLIRAEVFSDYLAMAAHLFEQGYHIAAAVLAGSTLESHIRALCATQNIPVTKLDKKGDVQQISVSELNDLLKGAGVYGLPEKQIVTAWYAARNSAAHLDKIESVTPSIVADMISGLRRFLSEHPA